MGFIKKTFDLRKFARVLSKHQGAQEKNQDPDALIPGELKPYLYDMYIHILRHDSIDISKLDFDEIGDGDIDDLENVLENTPTNELFRLSDVFRHFKPTAATGRIFI